MPLQVPAVCTTTPSPCPAQSPPPPWKHYNFKHLDRLPAELVSVTLSRDSSLKQQAPSAAQLNELSLPRREWSRVEPGPERTGGNPE